MNFMINLLTLWSTEKQIQYEVHFQKLSITNRISLLCPTGEFRQKISTLATLKIVVAAQLQGCRKIFEFSGDKV